jgi:hypothetical protein
MAWHGMASGGFIIIQYIAESIHCHFRTHTRSSGSSNSKIHDEIMFVPKVAIKHPTAGPTAEFMLVSPDATFWREVWRSVLLEPDWEYRVFEDDMHQVNPSAVDD